MIVAPPALFWSWVYRAIGGWRGVVGLVVIAALSAALGVQTARLADVKKDLTTEQASSKEFRDRMVELTTKAATLAAQARVEYHEASARAEASYQAGRDSANQYQATVVADLRSGNLRLRNGWQACMSAAPIGQAAPRASSGPDGPSNVQAEAFGRVFRIGADADNQVTWLQAELLATRQLADSCGKTE